MPTVAIIGRPNVGKSTLFNRLAGYRKAIVEDMPGITRDRIYAEVEHAGRRFHLIDTGGYDPEAEDEIFALMKRQVEIAISEADAVIFLLDGKSGITPVDRAIADHLRVAKKQVFFAVNKIDTPAKGSLALEFYEFGCDTIFPLSAEHGLGVAELLDAIVERFEPEFAMEEDESQHETVRVAVVGKPNSGKSTLINRLLGNERLLVSDMPGTTRDAIDTVVQREAKRYILIDTAGMRRKNRISCGVEYFSVFRAVKSVESSDIVLLMIDASLGVTDQDANIVRLSTDKGKGLIIAINKWDSIKKETTTMERYEKNIRETIPFASHAQLIFISALTGQHVERIFPLIDRVKENRERRITTAQLNRFFSEVIERHPPHSLGAKRVKIFYLSQVAVKPPSIVLFSNYPAAISRSYERYLINSLRERFDFDGTPIRIWFRKKPAG